MKRSSSFSVSRRGVLAASTVGALGVAIVAVPLLAVSASATNEHEGDSHKVTICHRNNDAKKPYVKESVDIASTGLLKSGHNDHTGDVFAAGMKDDHEKWGDIIPAYSYKISEHKTFTFAGLNWDAEGKAIWNAGCKVVVATPSETTPSEEPTDEPSSPEATATEEPTEEPTATESSATEEPSQEPSATESSATEGSGEGNGEGTPEPTATESTPEPTATESTPEPTATESTPEPTASESVPVSGNGDPGLPSTGGQSNGATLPKTGSDSSVLLAMAAGLVTAGAASIVIARRRTEAETD